MSRLVKSAKSECGFSLIEILVTLIIVTLGLLSSATLQALSKRGIYDAAQRTTAAHLAEDLLERMRGNPGALASYVPGATLGGGTLGATPGVDCGNATVTCTAAEMAAFDLWQWEQQLDGAFELDGSRATGGLVSPVACIQGPGFLGGNGEYTIAIAWRGMTALANPTAASCGEASGNYGDDNEYRRVVTITTYIGI